MSLLKFREKLKIKTHILFLTIFLCAEPVNALEIDTSVFLALNNSARSAYSNARAKAIKPDLPIFLVTDKITLIKDKDLGSKPTTDQVYETLKTFSHLALGIASASLSGQISPQEITWLNELKDLRSHALLAKDALVDAVFFSSEQINRQKLIVDISVTYIDDTLNQSSIDKNRLERYARIVAPLTLANANDASKAQLELINQGVNELKSLLTADEFSHSIALITGPKTAREGNLQSQYFLFLFSEKETGNRVIYTENVFDRDHALSILRTVLNDRKAGQLFYNDHTRLEKDLMADGATFHLLEMFGKLGSITRK